MVRLDKRFCRGYSGDCLSPYEDEATRRAEDGARPFRRLPRLLLTVPLGFVLLLVFVLSHPDAAQAGYHPTGCWQIANNNGGWSGNCWIAKNATTYDAQGNYVTGLQRFLNYSGYTCGTVDGVFGTKTDTALRAFQANNGLSADGICGTATWNYWFTCLEYWDIDPNWPAVMRYELQYPPYAKYWGWNYEQPYWVTKDRACVNWQRFDVFGPA
jgi:hypothetical protein